MWYGGRPSAIQPDLPQTWRVPQWTADEIYTARAGILSPAELTSAVWSGKLPLLPSFYGPNGDSVVDLQRDRWGNLEIDPGPGPANRLPQPLDSNSSNRYR